MSDGIPDLCTRDSQPLSRIFIFSEHPLTFDVLLSRVDAMTVRMVNKPESMDVIVATNRKRVTYTCTYLP